MVFSFLAPVTDYRLRPVALELIGTGRIVSTCDRRCLPEKWSLLEAARRDQAVASFAKRSGAQSSLRMAGMWLAKKGLEAGKRISIGEKYLNAKPSWRGLLYKPAE